MRAVLWACVGVLLLANSSAETTRYVMLCDVSHVCELPVPDTESRDHMTVSYEQVTTAERTSFSEPATLRAHLIRVAAFNSSAAGDYLVTLSENSDGTPHAVQVFVQNRDLTPPTIDVCGLAVEHVMMNPSWSPCMTTTARDYADGDLTASMSVTMTLPNGTDVAFAPHYPLMRHQPGKYTIHYSVQDTGHHIASASKVIYVIDDAVPVIALSGVDPTVVECGETYTEMGATAQDNEDGVVTVHAYGGQNRSCAEILASRPNAPSGYYTITFNSRVDGAEHTEQVWCDMETDGGGYTYLHVTAGTSVDRECPIDTSTVGTGNWVGSANCPQNTCHDHGMMLAIFRTPAQVRSLERTFFADSLKTVGGVYGTDLAVTDTWKNGYHVMRSSDPVASQVWKASDGGSWFVSSAPSDEPSGTNYNVGCMLKVNSWAPLQIVSHQCDASTGVKYVCSTNDKGGPGVLSPVATAARTVAPNFPPTNLTGTYEIHYAAEDSHQNMAIPAVRRIVVRDLTPPTITLNGGRSKIIPISNSTPIPWDLEDKGATCHDTCDAPNHPVATWNEAHTPSTLGRHTRIYTCKDAAGNLAQARRYFYIIAENDPILELRGEDPVTREAQLGVQFLDDGATCTDGVGHDVSANVIAYGEVVNMGQPGTYLVDYRCVDNTGRQAPVLQRTVHVVDTKCPEISLRGPSLVEVEAGFPFHDEGAIAKDNIDGDISSQIVTSGDTVNTAKAFYSRGSCAQIYKAARAEGKTMPSGDYFITVRVGRKARRLKVYCDMYTDADGDTGGYTMFKIDGGKPTARASDPNSCADFGMQIVVPRTEDHFASMIQRYGGPSYFQFVPGVTGSVSAANSVAVGYNITVMQSDVTSPDITSLGVYEQEARGIAADWQAVDGGSWFLRPTSSGAVPIPKGTYTPGCWLAMSSWARGSYHFSPDDGNCAQVSNYICSTNDFAPGDLTAPGVGVVNNIDVSKYPEGAETGKYVISYHVKDKSGNAECFAPTRTVVVKDTLPPVIDVKIGANTVIKGNLEDKFGNSIQRGQYDGQLGEAAASNLMALVDSAVDSGSSMWLVAGAAASAVGVALFLLRRPRHSVSPTV